MAWYAGLLVLVLLLGVALGGKPDNGTMVRSTEAPKKPDEASNGKAQTTAAATKTTQKPEEPKKDVCEVCRCEADNIDCSNRNLDDNLADHKWPSKPIKLVTFANNHITRIKQFPNVTVDSLIFCNNSIQKIDLEAFEYLAGLRLLDLSHNLLTHNNFTHTALEGRFKPEAWMPLDKLRVLNLSGNKFHTLDEDVFAHVTDLKVLILSDNPFIQFDLYATTAISGLHQLDELDLSRCKLKKLDEMTFSVLRQNLKKLNLSWNEFTELPHALQPHLVLETLVLDGNPIEILDSNHSFPSLPNLKELYMSNMTKLKTIEYGALANLENMEVLAIENCSLLTYIDSYAFAKQPKEGGRTWPPLKKLLISNNALQYLPTNLVARWDKLEELHVVNNKWSCDCDNQFFVGDLLPKYGEKLMGVTERDSLRCSEPPEHYNETLSSLSTWHLRCLDLYGHRPERDAAVLVGALIGILLAVPVTLALFVLWSRGFFFCGRQNPASFSRAFYKRTPGYEDEL